MLEPRGDGRQSEDRRVQCHSCKKRKPRGHAKCCGLTIKRSLRAPWVCQREVIGDADEVVVGMSQISRGWGLGER